PRIRRKLRQPYLTVETASAVFLENPDGDAAESEPGLIDQIGAERLHEAGTEVLSPPWNVGAEARHARRRGKRLEEATVAEAVSRGQCRTSTEMVIGPHIEMVDVVLQGRGRNIVGQRRRSIGTGIESGDGAADRMDKRLRNSVAREWLPAEWVPRCRQQAL